MARFTALDRGVHSDRGRKFSAVDLPATVVTASAHYDLGKDAAGNMAVGSAWPAIVPSATTGAGFNAAYGRNALGHLTTGAYNTAIGDSAMAAFTAGPTGGEAAGGENTAVGQGALSALTTGQWNVAVGRNALAGSNDSSNTMVGWAAAPLLNGGTENTGLGLEVFNNATGGSYNTALGAQSMANQNVTGPRNTAVGHSSLFVVTSGSDNTAVGYFAGSAQGTSSSLTAVGSRALQTCTAPYNTAIGAYAGMDSSLTAGVVAGDHNTYIGYNAGPEVGRTGDNYVTAVGAQAYGHLGAAILGATAATTANYGTAIGYATSAAGAGAVALGTDHTGAGASAGTQDYFVLGTANHKYFMPGLPAADPHVVGQLWKNSGVVTVSAG